MCPILTARITTRPTRCGVSEGQTTEPHAHVLGTTHAPSAVSQLVEKDSQVEVET
jgi:hypothetical protein